MLAWRAPAPLELLDHTPSYTHRPYCDPKMPHNMNLPKKYFPKIHLAINSGEIPLGPLKAGEIRWHREASTMREPVTGRCQRASHPGQGLHRTLALRHYACRAWSRRRVITSRLRSLQSRRDYPRIVKDVVPGCLSSIVLSVALQLTRELTPSRDHTLYNFRPFRL